jgi:excisionase family DNA binding protein
MPPLDATARPHDDTEVELSVEEVASRLGLPVGMVQRRIEAGLVPASRVESTHGVRYRLRLADLGIDDTVAARPVDDDEPAEPPVTARGSVELRPVAEDNPTAELMSMQLDPRELVAGLLDRWERTLEQRIHAEQRQRFEADLAARQSTIRELRLELDAVRAQQAAALGERDRLIEEQRRRIGEASAAAADALERARQAEARRRGWFRR